MRLPTPTRRELTGHRGPQVQNVNGQCAALAGQSVTGARCQCQGHDDTHQCLSVRLSVSLLRSDGHSVARSRLVCVISACPVAGGLAGI